jgi:hypothetical protein
MVKPISVSVISITFIVPPLNSGCEKGVIIEPMIAAFEEFVMTIAS